jgi:5-methylcytosine-specific restriction endonuclease McrA
MPTTAARARELLKKRRAVVARLHPFTIRIKDRTGGAVQTVIVKIDPGSKTTGLAVARVAGDGEHALWLAEVGHRGLAIRRSLEQRRGYRHGRRSRNLRYRAPRIDNRTKPADWLPPSLQHRVDAVVHWADRLRRLCPVAGIVMEAVRFDTQLLADPDISGVEYQQGTLAGYEIREWVLEKWGRACVYCGAEGVPLQLDHVVARGRLGQGRPKDFVPSCGPCNQKKGMRLVEEFLAKKPALLAQILAGLEKPVRDAAAVNSTRVALHRALAATGLPVRTGSGGRTKWNRSRFGVPKTHALDALCAGETQAVHGWQRLPTLVIGCSGRGSHQRTRVTADGFPRGYLMRRKRVFGFATGDLVRAVVPAGKKAGTHVGRVAVRSRGSFNIRTTAGVIDSVSHKHCRLLQRADGYNYNTRSGASSPP